MNNKSSKKISTETKLRLIEQIKNFEKSPFSFLIRRSKLTYLIIIFLLIFGIFTIRELPRELNPEVKIPYGMVFTVYPGASSIDVEDQVTDVIETELSDLEGVDQITSSSSFGASSISVEFEADQDLDESMRRLRDKVDNVKSKLPGNAEDPTVIELSFSDVAFLAFSLEGENYDKSELKTYAEDLKSELEGVTGVSEVDVVGGEEKEIQVIIQPDRLSQLGLTPADLKNVISAQNLNLPLGSIDVGHLSYSVRVENELQSADQIASLVITQKDGINITVGDVAQVKETFSKVSSISRLAVGGGNESEDTITLMVYKKTGGNITEITKNIKQLVEDGKGQIYPEDVNIVITTDYAKYIDKSISDLVGNGMGTVVIVLVLLLLFMGWREALITSLAVPFSFFIAFMVMALMDQSLNFITLFSLVLALGILVDSAVVIVEGMYEKIRKYRMTGYAAAMLSVQEYAAPLMSGLLTTVAAFFPLLFVKGIFGEFLKGIPTVVISTLVAALFVSLTIIPTIGALFLKPKKIKEADAETGTDAEAGTAEAAVGTIAPKKTPKEKKDTIFVRLLNYVRDRYYEKISALIATRKNRLIIIFGAWAVFFASLVFPLTGYLKMEAFGNTDADYFWVNLEMPKGTVLEETDKVTQEIEQRLYQLPEVENFVVSIGSGGGDSFSGGGASGANEASITVNLIDSDNRELTSTQIADQAKELLKDITIGEISVNQESSGPPSGSPLEVRVSGSDLEELERISEDLKGIMQGISGTENVNTNLTYLPGEFVIVLNPEILANYGLTAATVSSNLRAGLSSDKDAEISREGEEIDIKIDYSENRVANINDLKNLTVPTPSGESVALGTLGEIKLQANLASIRHQDEERSVTISGNNQTGYNINELMNEFKNRVANYDLPNGYVLNYGGESQEQNEVYVDMFVKMIIGIVLILFILVTQFNSFRQTLIILFTIPLAMIGVIWGMTIANLTLDIPAFIGIISLAGIVVNNAIILIDYINSMCKRRPDCSLVEAAAIAGKARLRPILLTTATTVLGLLPLSIREPDWRNMGFTIIFGLTFSTFLTLFVVPALYVCLEGGRKKKRRV